MSATASRSSMHDAAEAVGLDSSARQVLAPALAVAVPLVLYLATVSSSGYWLDAGELVAQGRDFGISHPPGHPLFGVLATAAGLVPLGSLAFRVALLSAGCVGLACFFFYRSARRTLDTLRLAPGLAGVLAVGTTWLTAGSTGWWLQAVRPEVYALQAALVLFIIDRLTALEVAAPTRDHRALYAASLAFGLALANHHFLALLLLPAAAPTLARALLGGGRRTLARATAFAALGLSTYLYLPLRASSSAFQRLGRPDDLERFWWVVSAQAFQKNTGSGVPDPIGERFADVTVQLALDLSPVTVLLALGGIYVGLRVRATRRIGLLWLLILLTHIAARAWLGFVRHNPDALGYLMPASATLALLAALLVGVILHAVAQRLPRVAIVAGLVTAGLTLLPLPRVAPEVSLATFRGGDAFDDVLLRELPPRSVILAHEPQTIFRIAGAQAIGERPDVVVVPIPLLPYPELVADLAERDPTLRDLLRTHLLEGRLGAAPLESLAAERPVFVEMDPRVGEALHGSLVPAGHYHRALADGATDTDVAEHEAGSRARLDRLLERVGDLDRSIDGETGSRLLWQRYQHALFLAGRDQREAALAHVEAARRIHPDEPLLVALAQALAPPPEGEEPAPLDLRPFRLEEL